MGGADALLDGADRGTTPGIDGGIHSASASGAGTRSTRWMCPHVTGSCEAGRAAGGKVVVPKMAIPGIGWLGLLHRSGGQHLRGSCRRTTRRPEARRSAGETDISITSPSLDDAPWPSARARPCSRAGFHPPTPDEVVVGDGFGPDEALLEIGVDHARRLRGLVAPVNGPQARTLFLTGGEIAL